MILGLRTVLYICADLAAAKAWYTEVLDSEPYFDEPFYVGFEVGGFELGLMPNDAATEAAPPGGAADSAPRALWGVADVDAALARLLSLGATALEPVSDVGQGIRVAAVTDPFGNRFGLIENPHFDATRVR